MRFAPLLFLSLFVVACGPPSSVDVSLGTVDPLPPPQRLTLECTGSLASGIRGPCGAAYWHGSRDGDLVLRVGPVLDGRLVYDGEYLELRVSSAPGSASACVHYASDTRESGPGGLPCADAGTVTLSAWPTTDAELTALRGEVHLHFPDGATLDSTFDGTGP